MQRQITLADKKIAKAQVDLEAAIKEQILKRQKENLDIKKIVDDNRKLCNEAIWNSMDSSTQYEAVSEICSNLTEIIKIALFKENG